MYFYIQSGLTMIDNTFWWGKFNTQIQLKMSISHNTDEIKISQLKFQKMKPSSFDLFVQGEEKFFV